MDLTSVFQIVVVLLILYRKVGLAAKGSERKQARSRARHRRDAGRLQAGRVRGQLDGRPVSGMGEVLRLQLLLLGVDTQDTKWVRGKRRVEHTYETQLRLIC